MTSSQFRVGQLINQLFAVVTSGHDRLNFNVDRRGAVVALTEVVKGKRVSLLPLLIDALNPQVIVLGSLAVVLGERVLAPMRRVVAKEALSQAAAACEIVPAVLGLQIGDAASLMAALNDPSINQILGSDPS